MLLGRNDGSATNSADNNEEKLFSLLDNCKRAKHHDKPLFSVSAFIVPCWQGLVCWRFLRAFVFHPARPERSPSSALFISVSALCENPP